jgi:hypothetical protein
MPRSGSSSWDIPPAPCTWPGGTPGLGLVDSTVPQMFSVAEADLLDFQRQATILVQAGHAHRGKFPPWTWLPGHHHFSNIASFGLGTGALEENVLRFIHRTYRPVPARN